MFLHYGTNVLKVFGILWNADAYMRGNLARQQGKKSEQAIIRLLTLL